MLSDNELISHDEDLFELSANIDKFIKTYINSDYYGSVLLSGKWGVGKTSFINQIKEKTKQNSKTRFVDINFWTGQYIDSPFESVMKILHPIFYWVIKSFPVIFVLLLAITQFFIGLITKNTEESLSSNDVMIWFLLFLLVSFFNLIIDKFSTELIFEKILDWDMKRKKKAKIVFVIDDFDRLKNDDREKLYSFMSKIKSFDKSLVVVIGEYKKIVNSQADSIMVQKVLSNIEYMPMNLMSDIIWGFVERELEKMISNDVVVTNADQVLFTRIRDLFIDENRTMREAKQVLNIFERVYSNQNQGNVNVSQQFGMCYLFHFYNKIYEWVNYNRTILYSESLTPYRGFIGGVSSLGKKDHQYLSELLEYENIDFSKNICEFLFYLFHDKDSDGFHYLSLSEKDYFSNYQIENVEVKQTLNINIVKKIFTEQSSDLKILLRLQENNQLQDFYNLYRKQYLVYERDGEASKEDYLHLLHNISIVSLSNSEENDSLFTSNYANSILYKTKEFIEYRYKMTGVEMFKETILAEDQNLELSQKLKLLPNFVAAGTQEQTQAQIEMVNLLFSRHSDFSIFNQEIPKVCFIFYTSYYKNIDPELRMAHKFDELLNLNDVDFYEYVSKKLTNKVTSYHTNSIKWSIKVSNIAYNDEFKQKFENKISSLDPNLRKDLEASIKEGEKW
jgi:DNA polymerase III delta prime subunit